MLGSLAVLVGMLVNIGLNLLLLPRYGLAGAVAATAAANLAALAVAYLLLLALRSEIRPGRHGSSSHCRRCSAPGPGSSLARAGGHCRVGRGRRRDSHAGRERCNCWNGCGKYRDRSPRNDSDRLRLRDPANKGTPMFTRQASDATPKTAIRCA